MVDQEIIDLPNDDAQPDDPTLFLPLQKNVADTRRRSLANLIPLFQTPLLVDINGNGKSFDNLHQIILRRNGNIPLWESHHTSLGPTSTLLRFRAFGDTSASATEVVYGNLTLIATDNTTGSESADWHFILRRLATTVTPMVLRATDSVLDFGAGFGIRLNGGDIESANLITAQKLDLIDSTPPIIETHRTAHAFLDMIFELNAFGKPSTLFPDGVEYGSVEILSADDTDGDESGRLDFHVMNHGVSRVGLLIDGLNSEVEIFNGFKFNLNGSNIDEVSNLIFASTTLAPLGTDRAIWYEDTEGMRFNALAGDFFQWDIDGNAEMRLDGTQLQLSAGQNILLNNDADIQWGGSSDRKIKNTTGGFEFEVETGDSFDYTIQDTTEYSYSSTQANFNGNNLVNLGTLNTHTIPGGTSTFTLISDNLGVFAATTSAQLAGVISDETGTGLLVFGTNPTLIDPTITSMLNANHSHESVAEGGVLDATLALDATGTKDSTTFLRGDNTWDVPPETSLPLTWAATDEDSPLVTAPATLYTTEAADKDRTITDVITSLKNAATGTSVVVDIEKETGVNTNVFASILTVPAAIDLNEFTSATTAGPPVLISDSSWQENRRLRFVLLAHDTNFAATGLKVTIIA